MATLRPTTDGVITIRPPWPADSGPLVALRDDEFRRFLGPGSPTPHPTGCIEAAGQVLGWVDHDPEPVWLAPDETNIGYALAPEARGQGHASRAVQLLVHHLAVDTALRRAVLRIHPDNAPSLRLAESLGFTPRGDLDGERLFERLVPTPTTTDRTLTIRPLDPDDLEADLAAKDDEQIRWLWLPGQRERWEALSPADQRGHALRGLETRKAEFTTGPRWSFAADTLDDRYVAFVEANLADNNIPHGEANISYSTHPAHRRQGHATRAVSLLVRFLHDHTATRLAHILADSDNAPSLGVARAVGAVEAHRRTTHDGQTMIHHTLPIR